MIVHLDLLLHPFIVNRWVINRPSKLQYPLVNRDYSSPNFFPVFVPGCNSVFEIGVVGKVATDGRMIAKYLVLDHWFAGSNCVEEIRLVS
jgi:hypothetical protein